MGTKNVKQITSIVVFVGTFRPHIVWFTRTTYSQTKFAIKRKRERVKERQKDGGLLSSVGKR